VDPLDHLADALFHKMGADGVYARTALYEDMVERLAALITRHREPDTEVMRFPPVMSRGQLEKSGYLKSFPNLLGCVCGLHGTERELLSAVSRFYAGGDLTTALSPADLVLSPAACYPVYPIAASRGPLPRGGLRFDVAADCFRREPSRHLDRLQSFRMREYVCIGSPDDVSDFRERWMVRAQAIARDLGLTFKVDYASDPFFGRVGQMKAVSQKQQSLKFELLIPLRSEEQPTACMSFNYHRDHFGLTWDIRDVAGEPAHTGCVAFGMDRLAVAMFHTHGIDPAKWPASVRETLGL
jgi:seryl-tRNA synthetase